MKRIELIQKLETVAPALSDSNLLPILNHFWFTGAEVMAYNDQIAISDILETQFEGAVPGRILLEMLKASLAKEVELEALSDVLHVKASRSNLKLGLRPPTDFEGVFKFPDFSDIATTIPTKEFMEAIEVCLKSVTNDTTTPDHLGVTIIKKDNGLSLFSTNNHSMSYATVTSDMILPDRLILSGAFCREMLRLKKAALEEFPPALEITDSYSLFAVADVLLYGRLIHSSHPLPYEEIVSRLIGEDIEERLQEIPSSFEGILNRALIITDQSNIDRSATEVSIKEGKMHFLSNSDKGEIKDVMAFAGEDVDTKISPKLIRNGLDVCDQMTVAKEVTVMAGSNSYYLVAAVGDNK